VDVHFSFILLFMVLLPVQHYGQLGCFIQCFINKFEFEFE